MDEEKKMQCLQQIYNQQHYFIDRHDAMAEKFINVLLVEVTCLSVIYTLFFNGIHNESISIWHTLLVAVFVFAFIISLVHLMFIVRPLSSKAKKLSDQTLINKGNKSWVKKSSLYYQGIIKQIDDALSNNAVPSECYINQINYKDLINDLTQQIFILAQYSNYKRKKLEQAVLLIVITTLIGFLAILSLILF